jgi:hypothetical protein
MNQQLRPPRTFPQHFVSNVLTTYQVQRGAEALRKADFRGSSTIIGDEPDDRPPLSKQVLKGWVPASHTKLPRLHSVDADSRLGVAATRLDRVNRLVHLANGEEIPWIFASASPCWRSKGTQMGMWGRAGLSDGTTLEVDVVLASSRTFRICRIWACMPLKVARDRSRRSATSGSDRLDAACVEALKVGLPIVIRGSSFRRWVVVREGWSSAWSSALAPEQPGSGLVTRSGRGRFSMMELIGYLDLQFCAWL